MEKMDVGINVTELDYILTGLAALVTSGAYSRQSQQAAEIHALMDRLEDQYIHEYPVVLPHIPGGRE